LYLIIGSQITHENSRFFYEFNPNLTVTSLNIEVILHRYYIHTSPPRTSKYPHFRTTNMEIHVYDTYVEAKDGHTMHFDVITNVKDHPKAIQYAKEWLKTIGEADSKVSTEECQFCHSQGAPEPIAKEIQTKGYFIQKMEGCP
jgi:Domain of unknown function (DUF2024)